VRNCDRWAGGREDGKKRGTQWHKKNLNSDGNRKKREKVKSAKRRSIPLKGNITYRGGGEEPVPSSPEPGGIKSKEERRGSSG